MKNQLLYLVVVVVGLMACEEEMFYPSGLYASQVERLLTKGDTGQWTLVHKEVDGEEQSLDDCTAQHQLHFYEQGDSIAVYEISTCDSPDSIYYGAMYASATDEDQGNPNLFSDSLVFSGGTQQFVLVDYITSTKLYFTNPRTNTYCQYRLSE
ncbi:hypothetical protein [Marinoscillum furvescens]|uniref:Lipocalin-like protein n=1 Tax=Marinoscillum furvescens DSM 4134 TaxID=1122208 RepID=A0A3D9LG10_MARFU|nr:hypothetical protein [Marinoscillum furvescens]REE05568.1 hypothetical protein C7460_10184 [Marinoscillum furvescens DSM 4134]